MQKIILILLLGGFFLPVLAQDTYTPLRQEAYRYYFANQYDSCAILLRQSLESQEWGQEYQYLHQAEIKVMAGLTKANKLQTQASIADIDSAFLLIENISLNIDTLRQKAWLARGIIEFKAQQFPQALQSWLTSEALLRRFPATTDTLDSYINLQNLKAGANFRLGQNQKAKAGYEEILPFYQEKGLPLQISHTLSNLGNISFATEDYSGAAKAYTQAIAMAEAHDPPLTVAIAASSMNLSYVLRGFGDYEGALHYAQKTEAAYQALNSPNADKVKMLMALIYADRGDFQQAIDLHKYYYRRVLGTRGPNSLEAKNILGNLALFYYNVQAYDEAETYARQVIDIIQQYPGLPPQYQFIDYVVLGSILVKLDRETEATPYFERAEELLEGVQSNKDFHLTSYYEALAKLYLSTGDYDQAIDLARKAENLWEEKELASISARISNLSTLAKAYYAQEDIEASMKTIQHSWKLSNLPDFNPGTDTQLPGLGAVPKLRNLAETLITFGDIAYLDKAHRLPEAYNAYRLAADLMDSIRISRRERGWSMDADYEVLYERDEVFDKGMEALFALYQQTGETQWMEEALVFSERNKATLLAESFAKQKAEQVFNIPVNILATERNLRSRILQLEQQLLLTQERPGSQLEVQVPIWEEEIYHVRASHDSLIQILRKQYPDYYRLTYQTPQVSIDELQDALRADEALVEYFMADSVLFTMVLYGDQRHFFRTELPSLWDQSIAAYHQEIYQSFLPQRVSQRPPAQLASLSHIQYLRFWKTLESLNLPEKILLVPDAELGYLSFETLISSIPKIPEAYSKWDYLIRKHSFRYTYAGSLLPNVQDRPRRTANKDFLAFAPTYHAIPELLATSRGDLGNLPYAQKEAQRLHQLMGGTLYTGAEASEEAFKEHAVDYRLIHVAGHAIVDNAQGLNSHIIFTEDSTSTEDQRLEIKELFNLDLQADLVVLSACETGVGKMRKGEGIISLAWGMIYAGAQSVATTLWQVNDQATEKLMTQFYMNLKQGMAKDQALHQAKMTYLSQGDHLSAHPYLWGSFIIVGDHEPVSSPILPWWWILGGFVGVGVVIGGVRLLRSARNTVGVS
ncbi:MAG: CHAT domain-containing protein [Bacteroidota bacterium]